MSLHPHDCLSMSTTTLLSVCGDPTAINDPMSCARLRPPRGPQPPQPPSTQLAPRGPLSPPAPPNLAASAPADSPCVRSLGLSPAAARQRPASWRDARYGGAHRYTSAASKHLSKSLNDKSSHKVRASTALKPRIATTRPQKFGTLRRGCCGVWGGSMVVLLAELALALTNRQEHYYDCRS